MGYSGSGKSTLAARLGAELGRPVLHLDRVNFLPGWRERDREEARAMTAAFLEKEDWVVDGNYPGLCQQERLEQADRIVLLLFGRFRCLWRAWRRSRCRSRASCLQRGMMRARRSLRILRLPCCLWA